jgi:membrane protease YdiL (CAAX protease family)
VTAGIVVGLGLAVFALLIHSTGVGLAIAVAGFFAASIVMATTVVRADRPLEIMGLAPVPRRTAAYVPAGLTLGVGLAILYRWHSGWAPLPQGITGFAFVATIIGATEELVFRGYVQGRMARLGAAGAVLVAAAFHTAYKTALFAMPPSGQETDLLLVATVTLAGGIAFGALRQLSGTVLAPLAAHALFDLLAYAEFSSAPWWVWS